jgi:hypothetical protein
MKGDYAIVRLVNGGMEQITVETQGRRLTLEEPGNKESFYVIREHSGSRISQRLMVHKDQLAALNIQVAEEDFAYKGE